MNEEITLNNIADVLNDIKQTCAKQSSCFGCPFCRFLPETAKKKGFYSASKLCALMRTFIIQLPRDIDTTLFEKLIREGRR